MKAFLLLVLLLAVSAEKVSRIEGDGTNYNTTAVRGEYVTISLKSIPTSGYRWELLTQPLYCVYQGSDSFGELEIPDAHTLAGTEYRQHFKFLAQAVGQDRIRLVYERPWTTEGSKTVEVTLDITG